MDLSISSEEYHNIMLGNQKYNVDLELIVPDSEANLSLGNFMVTVQLLNKDRKELVGATRPVLFSLTRH